MFPGTSAKDPTPSQQKTLLAGWPLSTSAALPGEHIILSRVLTCQPPPWESAAC